MKLIGSPPRPSDQWDVRPEQVAFALAERQRFATRPEPETAECAHCGDQHGPFVPEPHGARYRNDAQVLVCQDRCTAADPERHDIDPEDPVFASGASRFQASATDADYGDAWAADLATRIADSDAAWAAAHTKTTGGTA